jgi:hypothetical protein
MWGDFGGVEYDRRIDDELDSYHRKLHFYRAAWGLGKYLFTTEKIDVAMKKWLQ